MGRGSKRKAYGGLIQLAGPSTTLPSSNIQSGSITTVTVPAMKKARGSRKARLKDTPHNEVLGDAQQPPSITEADGVEDCRHPDTIAEHVMDVDPGLPESPEISQSDNHVNVYIDEDVQTVRRNPFSSDEDPTDRGSFVYTC